MEFSASFGNACFINYCLAYFLLKRGRLYSSCVWSSMLHGSETWPVRKENEVALQRAEMRMVRWMCNVHVKDRVPSKELRERLGIDDIILILQQNRLRWYGHVLQKEDNDWVKKCMEYEVEGSRPRGRPKRTWREVVQKDCQAHNLNRENAMDRGRWKKLIKIGWSGWLVGECFFWYRLKLVVRTKGRKTFVVVVIVFCFSADHAVQLGRYPQAWQSTSTYHQVYDKCR